MNEQLKLEVSKQLFSDHQSRHELFWRQFNRFSTTIIALSVLPHAKADVPSLVVWAIPFVTVFITVVCGWILKSEIVRYQSVRSKYWEVVGQEFKPQFWVDVEKVNDSRNSRGLIGNSVVVAFLIGGLVISVGNLIVLLCS